jgi:hypothetical protein
MRKKRTPAKPTEPQYFSPRHNFKLYAWIRANVALTPGAKIAWQALADRLHEGEVSVKYSFEEIGRDIGLGRDQAKRYVRLLERAGLLKINPRYRDNQQRANEFFFLWRNPQEIQIGDLGLGRRRQGGPRKKRVHDMPSDAPASGG